MTVHDCELKGLSKRDQYKLLLSREYEELVRAATLDIATHTRSLNEYAYTGAQRMELEEELRLREVDLKYYQESLKSMKGAENEVLSSLTVPSTESLSQFTGITCTTVL